MNPRKFITPHFKDVPCDTVFRLGGSWWLKTSIYVAYKLKYFPSLIMSNANHIGDEIVIGVPEKYHISQDKKVIL